MPWNVSKNNNILLEEGKKWSWSIATRTLDTVITFLRGLGTNIWKKYRERGRKKLMTSEITHIIIN